MSALQCAEELHTSFSLIKVALQQFENTLLQIKVLHSKSFLGKCAEVLSTKFCTKMSPVTDVLLLYMTL